MKDFFCTIGGRSEIFQSNSSEKGINLIFWEHPDHKGVVDVQQVKHAYLRTAMRKIWIMFTRNSFYDEKSKYFGSFCEL